jgi:putative membrane protein
MERLVRERTGVLTALLTIVSLALVFGAVLRVGPATALPAAPDSVLSVIPHLNALISATAIGTILTGIRAVKRGEIRRHQQLMVTTFGLFVAFLVLYLYRVSLVGPTDFAGPAAIETFVYLPILAIHILLAIVCIPLVYYVLLLAYSHSIAELPNTAHPRAGKAAAGLWLISFSLGIVVYAMLYWVF